VTGGRLRSSAIGGDPGATALRAVVEGTLGSNSCERLYFYWEKPSGAVALYLVGVVLTRRG